MNSVTASKCMAELITCISRFDELKKKANGGVSYNLFKKIMEVKERVTEISRQVTKGWRTWDVTTCNESQHFCSHVSAQINRAMIPYLKMSASNQRYFLERFTHLQLFMTDFYNLASSYPDTAAKKKQIDYAVNRFETLQASIATIPMNPQDKIAFDNVCGQFQNLKDNHQFLCFITECFIELGDHCNYCDKLIKSNPRELSEFDKQELNHVIDRYAYIQSVRDKKWTNPLIHKQKIALSESLESLNDKIKLLQDRYAIAPQRIQIIIATKNLFGKQLKALESLSKEVQGTSLEKLDRLIKRNANHIRMDTLNVEPADYDYDQIFNECFDKWFSLENEVLIKLENQMAEALKKTQEDLENRQIFRSKYDDPGVHAEVTVKLDRYQKTIEQIAKARADLNERKQREDRRRLKLQYHQLNATNLMGLAPAQFSRGALDGLNAAVSALREKLEVEPPMHKRLLSKINQCLEWPLKLLRENMLQSLGH